MYNRTKDTQRKHIKNTLTYSEVRKKRTERQISLRKKQRTLHLNKRRKESSGVFNQSILSLIQQIPQFILKLKSDDFNQQYEACVCFRKMLSIENDPPIEHIVKAGVVPYLCRFLVHQDKRIQFEALWTLTNICSGDDESVNEVIKARAVPLFIKMIGSPTMEVREQAIWCLGNIAGEASNYRDYILRCGILPPLITCLQTQGISDSLIHNAVWTISNLCRGKPCPNFELIKISIPMLNFVIKHKDGDSLVDALWAISYISDGDNNRIQSIMGQGLTKMLIQFLYDPNEAVKTPALRTIGNMVTGTDNQTQCIIDNNGLPALSQLLSHSRKSIRKESVWAISNIAAGTPTQIQSIFDANIFQSIIQLLSQDAFEIKKECAWTIANATANSTDNQVIFLVKLGCIPPLCELLDVHDPTIVQVCLEAIENILHQGKNIAKHSPKKESPFPAFIEQANGLPKIENLQHHDNKEIYDKAVSILENYFDINGGFQDDELNDDFSFVNDVDKDTYNF